MKSPAEILAAPGIDLRRWRVSDAEEGARVVVETLDNLLPSMPWARGYAENDPVVQCAEYIARCDEEWNSGAAYNYAITVDDEIVGSVSLMRRVGPGGLEIGYWVHRLHTGCGYATLASKALVDEAFRLPDVEFVEIIHDAQNLASEAIPRKLGFTQVERRPRGNSAPNSTDGMDVIWRLAR